MQSPSNTDGRMTSDASGMSSELRSDAKQLGASAKNRIHSELDARKGPAAEQARSLSSAFDRASDELGDSAPQWLKSAFQQGAQQVQKFADTLEQKDSRQIFADIQNMARNNPGAFLAGCAALGFAAARIFKAGAPENQAQEAQQPNFPPPQGEDPLFRSTGADSAILPSRAGEFA